MRAFPFLICLFFSINSFPQFYRAAFNNDLKTVLQKVLEDYPHHFSNIRGEIISTDVQATIYSCSVSIPAPDSSIICQNGNDTDEIYSWKQVVFETDDFDKAKQKFHEFHAKLQSTSVFIDNSKIIFESP